jgi:hypothetical protein
MSSTQKHGKIASECAGRKSPETNSKSATLSHDVGNEDTTNRQLGLEHMSEREAPPYLEEMAFWFQVMEDVLRGQSTVFTDQDIPFNYGPTVLDDVVGNDARA